MPRIKAEKLQQILSDAAQAKPIAGMGNYTYTPEEYNKIMAKNRAMGLMEENSAENYSAKLPEGSVEFDAFGNLKTLGRTQPRMIDLAVYTQNRYMVEKIAPGEKGVKMERPAGTYIIVVFGGAIVKAITAMNELPKTVKAFRFRKQQNGAWKFVGPEFIEDTVCYKMKKQLRPSDALLLRGKMEEAQGARENPYGDSLDDIA